MKWLRNLFTRRTERCRVSAPAQTLSFRPEVESLDERCLPNVSSALTAIGQFQFIVDNTNTLTVVDPFGQRSTAFDGQVQLAHAFSTPGGGFGADVVFTNGSDYHFDPFGGSTVLTNTQFGNPILDVGTAYNAAGQIRLDVLVRHSFGTTGSVLEYTPSTGLTLLSGLGDNVVWLNDYQDTNGGTGIAVAQLIYKPGYLASTLLVRKADTATGVTTLYNDRTGTAIMDYSQTVSPAPALTPNRTVVIDITFGGNTSFSNTTTGTYALEYTTTGGTTSMQVVGNNDILSGY
jgi:hypothetical protein